MVEGFRERCRDSPGSVSGGCCALMDVITGTAAEGGDARGSAEGGGREQLSSGKGLNIISWECKR